MKSIIYILVLFLLTSCFEDKGNYDYLNINTLTVSLDEMYSFRLDKDTTISIVPRLAQSIEKNKDNLKYVWLHSTTNYNFYGHGKFDTVGMEETLRFHINPEEKNLKYDHYFRLNVYDELTGINYPVNTCIKLVKPYDGAWMVLHNRNGQTELGAVEYMGYKIAVTEDAYYKETGKRLTGRPVCLGQWRTSCKYYGSGYDWNMFTVVTDDPQESGVYCQWKKFRKMDSLTRMVAPAARNTFDYQHVEFIDGIHSGYGAICLAGGVLYNTPTAMKIYKANIDLEGETRITYASKVAFASLAYDEAGHRFCFYSNTERGTSYDPKIFSEENENNVRYALKPIPVRDGNVEKIDPNHLDPAEKVVFVGAGYQYNLESNWGYYGYGLSLKGADNCYVYEFSMEGISYAEGGPSFPAYYQLKRPQGMDENSCFASTRGYSGMIFYASGNTVYRLDFKQAGGKATVIYTHPEGKVTRMKFARKGKVDDKDDVSLYLPYEFDPNRSLGITFDKGNGQSDFVILNLSTTGNVGADSEHYPAIQVYSGFGEIKDFVFL